MLLVLMYFSAMANNVIPGLAVTYVRSTEEHALATIIAPSRHGDNYIHLKYTRYGKEIEHNAAFDRLLFPIRIPLPSPFEGSPTCGRSPTRSPSPPVRTGPAPATALPVGWELATTMDGIPYYMDHNRGITTWERPQLPAYSIRLWGGQWRGDCAGRSRPWCLGIGACF